MQYEQTQSELLSCASMLQLESRGVTANGICDAEIGSGWVQGSRYKVHNVLDQDQSEYDPSVAAIWDHAEKFDPKTERLFRYLQACAPVPSQKHACTFACAFSWRMHAVVHVLTSFAL